MLDIDALERRWLKYKLKSYLPVIITLTILVFIGIGTLLWVNREIPPILDTSSAKTVPLSQEKSMNEQNASLSDGKKESITILEPSMDFVQSFQMTSTPEESPPQAKTVKTVSQPVSIPVPPKLLSMPDSAPASVPLTTSSVKKSDNSLTINRNESKLDIEELQSRFKETSNSNLGLFITRYYYDHGEYSEAYNYALKTNAINPKIDESWILFSKSLVKMGKTDQAKKTLQLYISQSNSETAKELLNAIEKGGFK